MNRLLGIVFGLAVLLPFQAAGAQATSPVAGRVVMGTAGTAFPQNLAVDIVELSESGDPSGRQSAPVSADGAFRAQVWSAAKQVLVSVVHVGVTYSFTTKPADTSVNLSIFEVTESPESIEVASDTSTLLKGSRDDVEVLQVLRVINGGDRTFVGSPGKAPRGVLILPVPQDAFDFAPAEAVNPHGIIPTAQGIFTSAPLLPGETSISYLYKVKAPRSGWRLNREVLYPTQKAGLLVGPGLTVKTAPGFDFKETRKLAGPVYQRYESASLSAGATIDAAFAYADEACPGLGYGAAVVGATLLVLIVGGSVYMRRKPVKAPAPQSVLTREALVRKIAELDQQFESGDIASGEYAGMRSELKAELAQMAARRVFGLIAALGLTKRLGKIWAVDSVDLSIETGETVAIVGPNGAGKSTLLRLLAGLLRPSAGTVEFDGAAPRLAKSRIGYLGHSSYLYPHLTVRENLEFFSGLYGLDNRQVGRVLQACGIDHKAGSWAGILSAGELQRAGLARALLHDPDFLILDEPSASLDEEAAAALPGIISRAGRTTVVATHDRKTFARADRILQLGRGRLLADPMRQS